MQYSAAAHLQRRMATGGMQHAASLHGCLFMAAVTTMLNAAMAMSNLDSMRALIVGAGPSGLLLAHRLLDAGANVRVLERRGDPRIDRSPEGRAYALGLGLRGRTAIRSVSEQVWQTVAAEGFGSDRFTLHLPFASFDLRRPNERQEPSILIYQTDLCAALTNSLEARHSSSGRYSCCYNARVADVDPVRGTATWRHSNSDEINEEGTFDLIAGCDGVNSAVRASVVARSSDFSADVTRLPGNLKVIRLDAMPETLSPDSVHLVPGIGGVNAFLEPTANGVCTLITWRDGAASTGARSDAHETTSVKTAATSTEAGGTEDTGATEMAAGTATSDVKVDLATLTDGEVARRILSASLPKISASLNTSAVGAAFVSQRVTTASTVLCDAYHYGRVVLLGDAAHSTGGVSGQGCNSALQDAVALADTLEACSGDVGTALPIYSRERVPEGHALYDLSLGPRTGTGPFKRLLFGLATVRDTLLSKVGLTDPPLQTLLTTSLKPFSQIRRERDRLYGPFPTEAEFAARIATAAAPKQE